MKTINTLVPDIYNLFDGHECNEENVQKFGQAVANVVASRLNSSGDSYRPTLRFSNIGRPCDRQLYYDVRGHDKAPLLPHTKIKFLFGDIIEEMLLFLAEEAGHTVTDQQKEVELEGIKGHMDCKIDGITMDVKSASSRAYEKFSKGYLAEQDSFGYIGQISAYTQAEGEEVGGFLAMDKQNGHLCTHFPDEYIDATDRIQHLKAITAEGEPVPERCFSSVPISKTDKSGNLRLGMECSYCGHKERCWEDANNGQGLRTFLYSNGPKYLTKVNKLPRVPELDMEEKDV